MTRLFYVRHIIPVILSAVVCHATVYGQALKPSEAGIKDNRFKSDTLRAGAERTFSAHNIKFCWCPAGTFIMGNSPEDLEIHKTLKKPKSYQAKQVLVKLTRGYWLGKTEVTQSQWKAVMGTTPWRGRDSVMDAPNCPAESMTWGETMSFCKKLTETERRAGRLPRDWAYTLPTDAQWEYACRAGTQTRYSYGDDADELEHFAWFWDNTYEVGEKYAHEVGTKGPNKWNFHDMHGNLVEWCRDWWSRELPGGEDPEVMTVGPMRVVRGGWWKYKTWNCRSATRQGLTPLPYVRGVGFRVALVPIHKKPAPSDTTTPAGQQAPSHNGRRQRSLF